MSGINSYKLFETSLKVANQVKTKVKSNMINEVWSHGLLAIVLLHTHLTCNNSRRCILSTVLNP